MKQIKKQWLKSMPWDRVILINEGLCDAQKTQYQLREKTAPQARGRWEKSVTEKWTITEALEICRACCDLAPFMFNNGNTFATIGKTLLEEWLNSLPSVEAQIARTTIGHYIADHNMVSRRELVKVLSCFDAKWPIDEYEAAPAPQAKPAPAEAAPQLQPVVQARVSQA